MSLKEKITSLFIWPRSHPWISGLVIIILIIGGWFLLSNHTTVNESDFIVATTDLKDQVILSGKTQSASAVDLGFADQGRVDRVFVKEGDKVSLGQVLATLEMSDLNASLKNAQAALTIAQSGARTNEVNLDKIRREQDSLVTSAYQKLLNNDLQAIPSNLATTVTAPTITGTYTGKEGSYFISVYPSNASSGASFTVTGLEENLTEDLSAFTPVQLGSRGLFVQFSEGTSYPFTGWTVEIPNKRSSTYGTYLNAYQSAIATRDRIIADAQASLDSSGTLSSVAQAKIDQARSALESILATKEKRTIRSPLNQAIVARVGIKPGASLSSGISNSETSPITLISENDYEVIVKTPENSIGKLAVGAIADITLEAYGKNVVFQGRITSINPAETLADGVPIYETHVTFTVTDPRIRSGMTATVSFLLQEKKSVLAIPESYIRTADNTSFVMKRDDRGKTSETEVQLGMRTSNRMVEITSGLQVGDSLAPQNQ